MTLRMPRLAVPASFLPLLLGLGNLTPTAGAQLGQPTGLKVDVQAVIKTATSLDHQLVGVARDKNGDYWVTGQRASPSAAHKLFKLDASGKLLAAYDQPPATAASPWGMRDLAYDGDQTLYGGCETAACNRVLAFDIASASFVSGKDFIVPSTLPGPVVRALAYDPLGAGSTGSLWTADLGSAVVEFDRAGNVLGTLPSVSASAHGAAIDSDYRTIWWFARGGSTKGNVGVVGIQQDLLTGQATGQVFLGDLSVQPGSGEPPGGVAGGCELYIDSSTDHAVPHLVLLAQAQSDTLYEINGRFNFGGTCGGTIGFRNDAPWTGNRAWTVTLSASASPQAFLLVHGSHATIPLTPPLFGLGCVVRVALAPGPVVLGPFPVNGGTAQASIPVVAGAGGVAYFQWLEAPSPLAIPLRLSDGGGAYVYP